MRCSRCGKKATYKGVDPYMEEIYPEDGPYEEEWWCDECYQERAWDI